MFTPTDPSAVLSARESLHKTISPFGQCLRSASGAFREKNESRCSLLREPLLHCGFHANSESATLLHTNITLRTGSCSGCRKMITLSVSAAFETSEK